MQRWTVTLQRWCQSPIVETFDDHAAARAFYEREVHASHYRDVAITGPGYGPRPTRRKGKSTA